MKNKRIIAALLLPVCLVAALGVWAVCSQVRIAKLNAHIRELENQIAMMQPAEPAPAYADADMNAIAAEFNGGVVTVGEAIEEYNMIAAYYEMMGMSEEEYAESAKITVLDGLIEEKVLEAKAREAGVYELSEQQKNEIAQRVQAEYEDNIQYYMAFRSEEGKSEEEAREETIAYLNENGYSYEKMLADAQQNAWRDRLYEYVTKDMAVTEDQLREFYNSQVTSEELGYSADFFLYEMESQGSRAVLWHPEGVRSVQAIMVGFDADQGVEYLTLQAAIEGGDSSKLSELEALYDGLEPRAQEALNRALAGEDFEVLMAEYGDAGITNVSAQSTMCGDAFRDAAMALAKPGDISGLVQTDGGICIIRYAGDVTPGQVPFEQVRDELLTNYEAELKSSQYNATVVQWVMEANAQYHLDSF